MILVLGPTGQIGRPLVESLSASGTPVRALAHSDSSAETLRLPGVEVVVGDIHDTDALRDHLDGVSQLFLLTPAEPDQTAVQDTILQAAVDTGVKAVVKLSVYTSAPDALCSLSRWHWDNDQSIAKSGLAYTILEPHTFMQSVGLQFAAEIRALSTISAAVAPNRTVTMVDARDVSEVAAAVLRRGEHTGETLCITGPQALSYPDCAAQIAEHIGRPVGYHQISVSEARKRFTAAGLPNWLADALVDLHRMYDTGLHNPMTDVTADLTGNPPRSFADFLRDNPNVFA